MFLLSSSEISLKLGVVFFANIMFFSVPRCSVNFTSILSSPEVVIVIVSLVDESSAIFNPEKSNLKLLKTGSVKLSPAFIASSSDSGATILTTNLVRALVPPVRYAVAPSITVSSSPIVTSFPLLKVTFSEPATIDADNFKFVSSAFVTAIVIP